MTTNNLVLQKIRHPVKPRMLQVARAYWITPYMKAVILRGEELEGFTSLSFNDHVKLFFPHSENAKPLLPKLNPNGSLDTTGMEDTIRRDFTPIRYDALNQELEIQLFMHPERYVSKWAEKVKPGDFIGVGGPKGSLMIPQDFDWFLMLGDETAIPAISRRLEELPPNSKVTVMIETDYPENPYPFKSKASVDLHWLNRNEDKNILLKELKHWVIPSENGFIWGAGESSSTKEIYTYLRDNNLLDKSRLKISSYWERGESDKHESFKD